jgi:hypothetical protein
MLPTGRPADPSLNQWGAIAKSAPGARKLRKRSKKWYDEYREADDIMRYAADELWERLVPARRPGSTLLRPRVTNSVAELFARASMREE